MDLGFKRVEILLVEDNAGDVRLTLEAFKESKIRNRISVAGDGVEALDFLRRQGPHAQAPRPDLIILDLNLPRKDGREILADIKGDPGLRRIPVVVLTTSRSDEDVRNVYNLHANCYISKPIDLAQFLEVIKSIAGFWLTTVELPPGD